MVELTTEQREAVNKGINAIADIYRQLMWEWDWKYVKEYNGATENGDGILRVTKYNGVAHEGRFI
jgi:hypothetical protein